jgi:hypothetical protein
MQEIKNANDNQKEDNDEEHQEDQEEEHYIFGYGSLMCPQSRAISAPTLASKDAHPVLVQHLVRTWSARVPHKTSAHVAISPTGSSSVSSSSSSTTSSELTMEEDVEEENNDNDHHDDDETTTFLIEGQTAMGVQKALNHNCSGVLIQVDTNELKQFDERELGYDRVEIDLLHIWSLQEQERDEQDENDVHDKETRSIHSVIQEANNIRRGNQQSTNHIGGTNEQQQQESSSSSSSSRSFVSRRTKKSIKVWVYIQRTSIPPNHKYPIAQSYVDIILRGCLTISPEFASKFLETTHGWWTTGTSSKEEEEEEEEEKMCLEQEEEDDDDDNDDDPSNHNWVEDRKHPFYVRADKEWSQEMAHVVDVFLEEHQPHALTKRRQVNEILKSFDNKSNGRTSE